MTSTPPAPVEASVVQVQGSLGGIRFRGGSGVIVSPATVATNAHVIEGAHGLVVLQGAFAWPVTEVRVDRVRDLCLLTVPGLGSPAAVMAEESPTLGEAVRAVGYPGGHGPVVSQGSLWGSWHFGETFLLQSDTPTSPGSSGGGLFDAQGRLLGLTTQTITSSSKMMFSIPVNWIRDLLQHPEGAEQRMPQWNLEKGSESILELMAGDPRNWPAWETAARRWVLEAPQDENAWLALGLTLDRTTRVAVEQGGDLPAKALSEAVDAYQHSLDLRGDPKTWNNLGVDLDDLNRFDEAERAYRSAIALDSKYALSWLNLGSTRLNAGRYAKAVEAFQTGLSLRPDEAGAWIRLAECHRMLKQREAALAALQIALRYRPLRAELWLDFGLLLVDLGRVPEAREVHTRLMSMEPKLAARLQASLNRAKTAGTSKNSRKHRFGGVH